MILSNRIRATAIYIVEVFISIVENCGGNYLNIDRKKEEEKNPYIRLMSATVDMQMRLHMGLQKQPPLVSPCSCTPLIIACH